MIEISKSTPFRIDGLFRMIHVFEFLSLGVDGKSEIAALQYRRRK
jgi:hypothetical protein